MAGGFAIPVRLANAGSLGATEASTTMTDLTSGGSANTMGAWTSIGSTTANDYTHLFVQIQTGGSASVVCAYDIAAATAGNEASGIIIANWIHDRNGEQGIGRLLPVGLLPAGSRIAARMASPTISDVSSISVIGFDSGYTAEAASGSWDSYGWTSGNVTGIQLDPGDTANTKGAWTEITASSTHDYAGFMLSFDSIGYSPAGDADGCCLIDIGVGASPIVLVPDLFYFRSFWSGGQTDHPTNSDIFWYPIKAGSRIVIRAQCRDNTITQRLLGVSFYGLRA